MRTAAIQQAIRDTENDEGLYTVILSLDAEEANALRSGGAKVVRMPPPFTNLCQVEWRNSDSLLAELAKKDGK